MNTQADPSRQGTESQLLVERVLPIFQRWLPPVVVDELIRSTKKRFYTRLLPPILVLWGFVFQRLNHDHTCDAAWSHLSGPAAEAFDLYAQRYRIASQSNAGYVQARQRLPYEVAQQAFRTSAQALQAELAESGRWHGQRISLFDGTTIILAATPELNAHYGCPRNQLGEAHWPNLHLVASFDLHSGVLNDIAEGPYLSSEHSLAVELIRRMGADYVHLGDRNFGIYHILQVIVAVQAGALFRLKIHQAKKLEKKGLVPGCDLDILWSPSAHDLKTCEKDLPTPDVPGRLMWGRIEKKGFRPLDLYLFTTLTDRERYPAAEIITLYGYRLQVELHLRHIKTTLDMNSLQGRSVDIVRKELLLGCLTYNLIRSLMTAAAHQASLSPLELSFSMCWRRIQVASQYLSAPYFSEPTQIALQYLLFRLAKCKLPKRKTDRVEPRAVWGHPQVYPFLKGSRQSARQSLQEAWKHES